jgi:hypothetical protein
LSVEHGAPENLDAPAALISRPKNIRIVVEVHFQIRKNSLFQADVPRPIFDVVGTVSPGFERGPKEETSSRMERLSRLCFRSLRRRSYPRLDYSLLLWVCYPCNCRDDYPHTIVFWLRHHATGTTLPVVFTVGADSSSSCGTIFASLTVQYYLREVPHLE